MLGSGKGEEIGSMHHYAWKWERGEIGEHTSLCLEVGKRINKGAHITVLGNGKGEENRGAHITVLGTRERVGK